MANTSISHGPRLALTEDDPADAVRALRRAATEHPAAGVRTPAGLLAYPELLARARRILTGLRARGASDGDAVVVLGLSLDDFFPAFWACVLGGMRPAVISEPVTARSPAMDRLRHTCELLESPLVLTDPANAGQLTGYQVAIVNDLAEHAPAEELHEPDQGDVALLMLSSGSTGAPKAAALTHRGIAEFAAGARRQLDVRPGETMLNWLPVDHSGALLLYHVLPVFTGSTNVHLPTSDVLANPLLWLEKAAEHQAHHIWAPTFGLQLTAELMRDELELGAVRSVVSGGEQIVLPVVERFFAATASSGLDRTCFRPAWGMAETATAITIGRLTDDGGVLRVLKSSVAGQLVIAPPDTPEADCTTFVAVGGPAPGASIRVVDEDDQVLPELRIGRLQVRSNRITAGYVNNEPATAAALPDGEWLRTGDLAFVSGGQVVITGREGDTVIVNGNTVFCHEIEEVAGGVEGLSLRGIGACGVPNAATGTEDLVVFLEDDGSGGDELVPAVKAELFRRLRLTATDVVRVPSGEFPRTASGKVRRNELRERYQQGWYDAAARGARIPAAGEVAEEVRRLLSELAGGPVGADVPFYELGLTSIKLVRLRAALADRFGIDVPATVPFEHPTAAALTAWLTDAVGTSAAIQVGSGGGEVRVEGLDRRVAVVGMAARFPGARSVDEFWANLCGGVDSVSSFTGASRPDQVLAGGVLDDAEGFDAEFFGLSPKEATLTDAAHRQFLEVAHQALEHGGYAAADTVRIGVYAGAGMNLYGHQDRMNPSAPNALGDVPTAMQATIGETSDFLASRVAYRLGLTGPAIGVQTACSTSLVAVHLAVQGLLTGDADLAIAGAAAIRLPQDAGYEYVPGSILSRTGRCRPFDADADGTVGGNGVAAVLLKRLDRALADGDTIHAVILGSAVNNDGTSKVGFTAPSVAGQVDVVRRALQRAGVGAETVSYVEAHGTGTALGDPIEFEALSRVFGPADARAAKCALGSVKANVGHLDSCAGMAGLVKAILMLQYGRLVPTLNLNRPHPDLRIENSPFELVTQSREWNGAGAPRRAGVSALGVGGTNAHVVLEQPPEPAEPRSRADEPVVLPVSAKSESALRELIGSLRDHLAANPGLAPADVATTLALGRRHHPFRQAVAGVGVGALTAALDQVTQSGSSSEGPLVFAYSGQGAAYLGMSDWLSRTFEPARKVFDEVGRVIGGEAGELTQVGLFANQVAWTEVWRSLGVVPDLVVGHSVGEYAALYAAGALSLEDGARLTARRGELMRAGLQPGAMVAVVADRATAERIAAECGVEVAVSNGPDRQVLSGPEPAMARVAEVLDREGVTWRRMAVDRAFHSVMVEPVLDELSAYADRISFQPFGLPFVSGLDGSLLTSVSSQYVVDHARRPVRFDLAVAAAQSRGASRFLEVGPDVVLTPLGRRMSPGTSWVASQRRGSGQQFAEAVAELYRAGTDINWAPLSTGRRIPLPGHPLTRRTAEEPPAAVPARQVSGDLLDRVRELVAPSLGMVAADVPAEVPFLSLGADSLSLMRLVGDLEETFGVAVPVRSLFEDVDTPAKLADLLGRSASSPSQTAEPTPVPVPIPIPAPAAVSVPVSRPVRVDEPREHRDPAPASSAKCDFSLYFFGDYPDSAATDKYGLILRATEFADQQGFHTVWLPERHFHSFGALFPNPSVLAAALATRTRQIRLHAGSVVLPLHHPIRVAEEWSVVDNLSGGRAGICVASGWHARDFVLAPDAYGNHRTDMYERLDTVRKLWAGETITATAGNGEPTEVRLHPSPIQDEPPLFTAVVGNPESYKLAARHGLGIVTNLMAQSVEDLARNLALYRSTRAEHGLDPDAGRVVVLLHTYVGEDLETVRAEAYQPFCDYLRSSLSLFGQVTNSLGFQIDLDKTAPDDVDFLLGQAYRRYCESRALIGTRESCREIVDAMLAAGANELACFVDFGLAPDQVMQSLTAVDQLRAEYLQAPVDRGRRLTPPEKRIWFLEQLDPGANTYHEPKAIELRGPLDQDALRGALQRVVDRHPALRTEYREIDGEPRAFVRSGVRIECELVDAEGNDFQELLRDVRLGELELSTAPLLRARLVRLADDHHVLLLVGHHIVFDSASTPVVTRDLGAYYRSWPADPGLPPAVDALPDDSPTGGLGLEHRDFWLAELADAPELRLPTDRPRPRSWSGKGRSVTQEMDEALTSRLSAFAGRAGVTVFSTLLAGLSVVLSRFSGQRDFVIGTGVSGRGKAASEAVGMFVDTLPLRIRLPEDTDLAALARSLGLSLMDAVDHRDLPFEEIVAKLNPDRSTGRNPLFGVMVEFENLADEVAFAPPAVSATLLDLPSERAPLDLLLYLTYAPSGVQCVAEYDTDLFDESTIRRLLRYLELTLDLATRADNVPPAELAVLTAEDDQLLSRLEGEPGPAPTECLQELFERQADLHPDALALTGDFGDLTYAELDQRSNWVAAELISLGVERGRLVGSCLPRGPEQVAVLLGVLKAGAGYLPLDPAAPVERLRFLFDDSDAVLLVTREGMPDLGDRPTLRLDLLGPGTPYRPEVNVTADDLAYCMYTSGSTGLPKGVLVPHRGPVNHVLEYVAAHEPTRTLQWVSPTFDVSMHEIFTTFATGRTLVLIEDAGRYDPAELAAQIRRYEIQRIAMPFSAVHSLLATRPQLPSLREIYSAGEATTPSAVEHEFLAAHPDCVLYNGYGPTETSIVVTEQLVARGDTRPPIGRPIRGVRIRLLDADRRPVPPGAIGEICVEGVCVTDGYLNRPEETATAFFAPNWYATGDLGRWRSSGELEFHGRADDQVQLRGIRVEPGEIRAAVLDHPAIEDAAVVVNDGELVGYTVGSVEHAELTEYLAMRLPQYLVPRRWVRLDRLPLTTTGKLARSALPAPAEARSAVAPATPLERVVRDVWCDVLERMELGVTDSFFELGGHSLLAVRLLNRIREATGIDLTLTEFFRAPTVRAVAALGQAAVVPAAGQVSEPVAGEGPVVDVAPLTFAQQRALGRHRARRDASVYNSLSRVDVTGPLDPEALRDALQGVVQRHGALRTRVFEDRQEVLDAVEVALPVTDLPDDEDQIHAWCAETARPALEPTQAPLWRVRLGRVSANRWVLVVAVHHLINDGWSARLFWEDLSALYRGAELPPPSAQYTDYARWERASLTGSTRAKLETFWRDELAGASLRPALPIDHPRPEVLDGLGSTHHVDLPPELADRIRSAAAAAGTTPYLVIAAAFARWLGDLCGHDEVVLPVSSARRRRSEYDGVLGYIGEAVLVRVRLDTDNLLAETARALYAALDHETLPLAEVVRTALPAEAQSPYPAVLFTVITTPPATLDLPTGTFPVHSLPSPDQARTELYVVFTLTDTTFTLDLEYSTALFTPTTINTWSTTLTTALQTQTER
ncbi:MupA/Atu3671 family FMN-dependent luciferase-like monooxygenase [Kribbella sp. NPDC050124]|uniref:MupA/Atu3671 family FMN-dependent luciferase-like monooxygenase n=1 Tax=Kribbella sp. NPDC050124 TaxID=3364114 RepID=UPI003799BB37